MTETSQKAMTAEQGRETPQVPPKQQQMPKHVAQLGEEESVWFKLTSLLKADDPMSTLQRMAERYGGIIPIKLKSQKIWFITEPEYYAHILVKKPDNYVKYFHGMSAIFGKSMITIDGALWNKIRKPQQPAFHPNAFEGYFPYLQGALNDKISRWRGFARSGETIEMVEETWTLAADMVCKALFDRDMPFNPHMVFGAVKTYTNVMEHKNIRLRKVNGQLQEASQEEAAKAMDLWISIPDTVIGAVEKDHREKHLLKMLQAAENDPDFPEFDHQQTLDEMKQYLWAGTETTALTLSWAMYISWKYPEIAEKIRAEGEAVYGNREMTWPDVAKLTYTRQVIQETMRVYPPVWALIRTAAVEDEIGGHKIMPGDRMVMCTYVTHHDPKYWDEPEKFIPERFEKERVKARAKYSYLPFAAGKRACIGGTLSQVENTMALSQLLRRFRPEYVGPDPAEINPTVTLTPKGGLPFKIHELS